jgi:hypothetical protein
VKPKKNNHLFILEDVSRETLKIKSNFPIFKKMFHVKQKQLKI